MRTAQLTSPGSDRIIKTTLLKAVEGSTVVLKAVLVQLIPLVPLVCPHWVSVLPEAGRKKKNDFFFAQNGRNKQTIVFRRRSHMFEVTVGQRRFYFLSLKDWSDEDVWGGEPPQTSHFIPLNVVSDLLHRFSVFIKVWDQNSYSGVGDLSMVHFHPMEFFKPIQNFRLTPSSFRNSWTERRRGGHSFTPTQRSRPEGGLTISSRLLMITRSAWFLKQFCWLLCQVVYNVENW